MRIADLARELVELSGLREPDDIEIVFTGIRPGEKLREELSGKGEELVQSIHEKVHVVNGSFPEIDAVLSRLALLEDAVRCGDEAGVRRLISDLAGLSSPRAEGPVPEHRTRPAS